MEQDKSYKVALPPDCFEMLTDLAKEIGIAIDSIARNSLSEFERSLWRQEMLSIALKRTVEPVAPLAMDPKTRARLGELAIALKTQCPGYEALIQDCSQSNTLLQHLCHLYRHTRGPSNSRNVSSLSCEA